MSIFIFFLLHNLCNLLGYFYPFSRSVDIDDEIDDQFLKLSERGKIGKRNEISWSHRRRKSSVSLDDNFLSQISGDTQESVLQH